MAINLGTGYPLAAGAVTRSVLNAIFAAIVSKFAGGIDNSDISASAAIATSKLAADNYELLIPFTIMGTVTANEGLLAGTGSYHVVGSVPYDAAAATYTIVGLDSMTYAAGARTAAVYTLLYGTAAAFIAGTATTILSGITTGTGAATFTAAALTPAVTSITTDATLPKYFILDVTTQGVTWAVTDSFSLTIKLKKALRT